MTIRVDLTKLSWIIPIAKNGHFGFYLLGTRTRVMILHAVQKLRWQIAVSIFKLSWVSGSCDVWGRISFAPRPNASQLGLMCETTCNFSYWHGDLWICLSWICVDMFVICCNHESQLRHPWPQRTAWRFYSFQGFGPYTSMPHNNWGRRPTKK